MSLKNKKHLLAISLPIIIIGICIFWIVRLELNAAALTSRVDELHNALKQNKDNLANLESFWREVNKSGITLDKNGGMLYKGDSQIFWDENSIRLVNKDKEMGIDKIGNHLYMINDDMQIRLGDVGHKGATAKAMFVKVGTGSVDFAQLFLGKEEIQLTAGEKYEVRVGVTGTQKASAYFTKEGAKLELGPQKDFYVNLSHDKEQIEVRKGDSKILIGDLTTTVGSKRTGIYLGEKDGGTLAVTEEKGIGIKTRDGKGLEFHSGTKKDFFIKLSPDLNQVLLKKGESEIQVGQTRYGNGLLIERMDSQIQVGQTIFGEGISFGEKNTATLSIVKGQGLAIKMGGSNEMRISGEDKLVIDFKGDVDINAWGNLNLNSLNGNVNLVGKRINFNE